MNRAPRVVIDTNLILSALIFTQGRLTPLRRAWQDGQCQPLASQVTVAELMRVLAYPKLKLTPVEQQEVLADYLPWCTTVTLSDSLPAMPACRDPFDLPFLQRAVAGQADFLVTDDQDLLNLPEPFVIPILTAERFMAGPNGCSSVPAK